MTTPTTQREADERAMFSQDDVIELLRTASVSETNLRTLYAGHALSLKLEHLTVFANKARAAIDQGTPQAAPNVIDALREARQFAKHNLVALAKIDAAIEVLEARAATDQPSAGQVDERARFDARAIAAGFDVSRDTYGEYHSVDLRRYWSGWQWHASLTPTAPQAASQQAEVPAHYRKVLAMPDGPNVVGWPLKVCRVCGSDIGALHALNCTHGTSTVVEKDCRASQAATTASAPAPASEQHAAIEVEYNDYLEWCVAQDRMPMKFNTFKSFAFTAGDIIAATSASDPDIYDAVRDYRDRHPEATAASTCTHPYLRMTATGDGTPVEHCPDCGMNRVAGAAYVVTTASASGDATLINEGTMRAIVVKAREFYLGYLSRHIPMDDIDAVRADVTTDTAARAIAFDLRAALARAPLPDQDGAVYVTAAAIEELDKGRFPSVCTDLHSNPEDGTIKLFRAAPVQATDVARDAARYRFIEERATMHGGGRGFTITCFVGADEEDMGIGIDRMLDSRANTTGGSDAEG